MNDRKVISMKEIMASEWFKERPAAIQQAIKTWPPGWYKMKTGQEVRLYSYEENLDGKCQTCKVIVESGYNVGALIFGVPLTDLMEELVVPAKPPEA